MTLATITFLNVGQGDSILVTSKEGESSAVVVDVPDPKTATERLVALGHGSVDALFITHYHADHTAPLPELWRFVQEWRARGGIGRVFIPRGMIARAIARLKTRRLTTREDERLKATLDAIANKPRELTLVPLLADNDPILIPPSTVIPLHPTHFFQEKMSGLGRTNENEVSLVLRIEIGRFAALLLADIEDEGIAQLQVLQDHLLRAKVVKIPHHGAWPLKPGGLEDILRRAGAELTVLSVGSRNAYAHVRPELFACLIGLQDAGHVGYFKCTQVTRTCVHDAATRRAMGKNGLPDARECAGEISVHVKADGTFEVETETDHAATIGKVEMAACERRADLSS